MADKRSKVKNNISGQYYVDQECIACDACELIAPHHFALNDDGYAYVKRQPKTSDEEELCKEAMECCPVESIGNDGCDEPV